MELGGFCRGVFVGVIGGWGGFKVLSCRRRWGVRRFGLGLSGF